jgi:protein gp37
MSLKSNVTWCDSAVNPVMGCAGCELWTPTEKRCYAGVLTERYAGRKGWPASFDAPQMFPGRMEQTLAWPDLTGKDRPDKPWLNRMPRVIFISDMGDALSKFIPFGFLADEIIRTVNQSPHIYIWLTKRPGRMAAFAAWLYERGVSWPDNLWAATSVTGQDTMHRVEDLLKVPAKIRMVSVEPILERVDLKLTHRLPMELQGKTNGGISGIIVGGESGPGFRHCKLEWIADIAEQCKSVGVGCFVKQFSGPKPGMRGSIPDELWNLKQLPKQNP